MKLFNLERALAGDPVVTRDGRPVKIAGYDEEAQYWDTLIGWAGGYYCRWNKEGQHFTACETDFDLFMAPTERKEWIVRCVFGDAVWCEGPFPTENAAILYAADNNELRSVYEITIHE